MCYIVKIKKQQSRIGVMSKLSNQHVTVTKRKDFRTAAITQDEISSISHSLG